MLYLISEKILYDYDVYFIFLNYYIVKLFLDHVYH